MITIKIIKGHVHVQSEILQQNPICALPIGKKVKVKSVIIPTQRPSFNEWIQKHF